MDRDKGGASCADAFARSRNAEPEAERAHVEPQCNCTLRARLLGDGCSVCNPKLARELAND